MIEINEQIRKAWRETLREFITLSPVGEKSQLDNLLVIIQNIRARNLIRECKDESFVRHVYNDIRHSLDFYILIMSVATTFKSQFDDFPAVLKHIAKSADIYSERSGIIDRDGLQRRAPNEALYSLLADNNWLAMLIAATFNQRDTLDVLVELGVRK